MKAIVWPTECLRYHPRTLYWKTAFARFWIGHCHLTHWYLLVAEPQCYCEDCLVPLAVVHFLVKWPFFVGLALQIPSRTPVSWWVLFVGVDTRMGIYSLEMWPVSVLEFGWDVDPTIAFIIPTRIVISISFKIKYKFKFKKIK